LTSFGTVGRVGASIMQVERLRKRGWPSVIPPAGLYDALRAWCRSAIFVVCACGPLAATTAYGLQRATLSDTRHPVGSAEHPVRAGDTVAAMLARYGVDGDALRQWTRASRSQPDLRRLMPGRAVRLERDSTGRLRLLRYNVDDERALILERRENGKIVARNEALPVVVRAIVAHGAIERTFVQAARAAAIPDAIVSQMVDLLSWKLTFKSDVQRGDTFHVLYEERTAMSGRVLKPGRILAVEYRGRSEAVSAYLLGEEDGEPVYVDGEGRRLNGAPLRFPVEYTRISSEFSTERFHPILLENRPHLGVDFAAPEGTPVRAIAAGVVQWAGAKGGFGNHVEIDHGTQLVSAYSHLQAIDSAIKIGEHVARGQLLGSVGQTGLATGPHLHFAIFQNGEYIDPLSVKQLLHVTEMSPQEFARFRAGMQARLHAAESAAPAPGSAPEIGLPLAKSTPSGSIHLTF
jgi:murein DD-endopeptidase MepM/ murein hydrolase activator NlpD